MEELTICVLGLCVRSLWWWWWWWYVKDLTVCVFGVYDGKRIISKSRVVEMKGR
jgi:hypothetical protein